MSKFHYNPETGKTGRCTASVRPCKYNFSESDHYSTEVEAREAYEKFMNQESSPVVSKTLKKDDLSYLKIQELRENFPNSRFAEITEYERFAFTEGDCFFFAEELLKRPGHENSEMVVIEVNQDGDDYYDGEKDHFCSDVVYHIMVKGSNNRYYDVNGEWDSDELTTYILNSWNDEYDEYTEDDLTEYSINPEQYWENGGHEKDSYLDALKIIDKHKEAYIPLSEPEDMSYRIRHQPIPTGAFSYQLDEFYPDFYDHPSWYRTGDDQSDKETLRSLLKIRGNPEAKVTIYRGVPKHVTEFHEGNWVSLSRYYAAGEGSNSEDGGHVISQVVLAKELRNDGDSMNEFGWFPNNSDGPVGLNF